MKRKKVIEVKDLVKKYDDIIAINGVSFDVFEREIFGLLGPNGAGKTTTLEIIETLTDESSGDVEVLGISINRNPAKIRDLIGVQLQQSGFYPGLKLKEQLELFGSLYNTDIDVDQILIKVNLLDKKDSKVEELSGGQKQRFSIATTLINKPKIIFLDEPTTGLDPQARRSLWDLIREIRDSGTTVVLTTHYMDEAEILCDRVGIMDKGELLEISSPNKLIDDLIERGFTKKDKVKPATLEDVFLDLTGHQLRD
jgi:ABC-2 type transport system ATP-binding protein